MEDTMTTKAKLAELNTLRTIAGLKPLKAWKDSTAKLDAAIFAFTQKKEVVEENKNKIDEVTADKKSEPAKAKTVKKTKAAKTEKPADGTSIATIASELDMDPKVARAKLRRAFPDHEGAWNFTNKAEIDKIKAVLQGDARKKD